MAAVLFLGEDFTWINAMGLMVLVSGVIVFNYFRYQKSLQTDLVTKKSHSLDTVEDGRQVGLLFHSLKVAYWMLCVLGWLLLGTTVTWRHASISRKVQPEFLATSYLSLSDIICQCIFLCSMHASTLCMLLHTVLACIERKIAASRQGPNESVGAAGWRSPRAGSW